MNRDHPAPTYRPLQHSQRLFAALYIGSFGLALVDLYADRVLAHRGPTALAAGAIVLLGTLAFRIVERVQDRRLRFAYFAVQLGLGVLVFEVTILGGTFLLLTAVAQSVRVLPPWGTLLIGAPLPLLHLGMDWPDAFREGGTIVVALAFLVGLNQALVNAERARAALAEANRALSEYAAQSEELATARERNRIAREIHDGLGHYLTTIHMQIQAARSIRGADPARADQTLAKAQKLAQEALDDVRRSVGALRTTPVEHQSLPAALAELTDAASAAGLPTSFAVIGAERQLDPPEELALYRAAQEGLTNARKHAAAAAARVVLDFGTVGRVRLTVADDGQGAASTVGGFGLVGLRERVQLVGGTLALETASGAGLALTVEVPG